MAMFVKPPKTQCIKCIFFFFLEKNEKEAEED